MDKDYQDYKDFDMKGAVRGIPPQIARLQAKHLAEKNAFDDDLVEWVMTQDNETKQHINQVVRHFMAVKTA